MKIVLIVISVLVILSGLAFAQNTPRTDNSSSISTRSLNPDDDSSSVSTPQSTHRNEVTRLNDSSSRLYSTRFGYSVPLINDNSSTGGVKQKNQNYKTLTQPTKASTTRRTLS